MLLPHHGRYAYSPITERPTYAWPGGKRLAFFIGLNIEHFAFGAGLSHSLSVPLPAPDQRAFAWTDYGNRVGIWRIFGLLDELGLPASHNINTTLFEYAPQILAAIKARGDEVIAHGRTNAERHSGMWEKDEARFIAEVRDEIEKHWGRAPLGWMPPWMSVNKATLDLLDEAGFKFVMDWPAGGLRRSGSNPGRTSLGSQLRCRRRRSSVAGVVSLQRCTLSSAPKCVSG